MCGLVGKIFFNTNRIQINKEITQIKDSLHKLQHRGPDGQGYAIDHNVWLGSTRLSIIDLSKKGIQPIKNENSTIFLVFNGEIYNYKDLKEKYLIKHKFRSDTDSEVLIHLYEEFGVDCVRMLRGMFAFCIWDSNRNLMFLARDRLGKKPLKYYFNSKFFVFASELKAFIDWPEIPKEIDYSAVDEFLTYSYVPTPKTGFKNIYKLPPASYMVVSPNGKITIEKYWDIDFSDKLKLTENEWQEKLLNKLKDSIKLRLQSDVTLGIHLSGGIDSSLITALASQLSSKKVKTFTVGFGKEDNQDFYYANLVAAKYHTEHYQINVKPDFNNILPELTYYFEEPFGDPSSVPTYLLMKESKKYITVALNGDGGDENFAGYSRYLFLQFFNLLKILPIKKQMVWLLKLLYRYSENRDLIILAKYLNFPFGREEKFYDNLMDNNLYGQNAYQADFKKKIINSRKGTLLSEIFRSADKSWGRTDKLSYTDIRSYLPDYLLVKADIASMSQGVEVRSPLLDHQFMELTAKMPANFKLKFLKSKYIFKKMAAAYLPPEIVQRWKKGFLPPLKKWLSEKKFLLNEFNQKQFSDFGIFTDSFLNKIVEEHFDHQADHRYLMWNILILKNWLATWFGEKKKIY
ncbi:asparagine synthase (glutamine-hydrolyzing) [Candidatus Gottesmanbacteria bacterium RBG_16_38_7b]|uniref:asparagine synthase (glutamine-hydrolyzing) n=1 Tax=Candidatus Gottesmanbacteria bacterium RBG_16_38_7b TaxID=1798372 RepID=A0A1F5YI18_9BACT|nr:MAG: asparagine synthase (glutamine-hydrolyzing) [Candidatus Gottesmanbacteria bacterium RBG_16_38_7b]